MNTTEHVLFASTLIPGVMLFFYLFCCRGAVWTGMFIKSQTAPLRSMISQPGCMEAGHVCNCLYPYYWPFLRFMTYSKLVMYLLEGNPQAVRFRNVYFHLLLQQWCDVRSLQGVYKCAIVLYKCTYVHQCYHISQNPRQRISIMFMVFIYPKTGGI